MTYAIGHVILGIDLTQEYYRSEPDPWYEFREELEPLINGRYNPGQLTTEPTKGFGSAYSGSGDQPQWFGISLGEFNECNTIMGERMIQLCTPSMDQILEYDALVGSTNANQYISVKLRAALASTKARVLIVWGSS